MNTNRNSQNYKSDIPQGRSTSRIKNASQSQGFANKDLYGSNVGRSAYSNSNRQMHHKPNKSRNTASRTAYKPNPNMNNTNNYQRANYSQPPRKKVRDSNGEMSESTMVKVIVGSILAAVLLAIIIIVVLCFMDFQL